MADTKQNLEEKSKSYKFAIIVYSFSIPILLYSCVFSDTESSSNKKRVNSAELELDVAVKCQNLVRSKVKFPEKVKFPIMGGAHLPYVSDKAKIVYAGNVELMNGLGLMVPHKFICNYDVKNKTYELPFLAQ
tara:strand:- start:116 stop:511 length:396 start_codon:yes stop_codon:yes gene_type:complete